MFLFTPVALVLVCHAGPTPSLVTSLERYPARKSAWLSLLSRTPKEEQPGVRYLLTYMPLSDLKSLNVDKVSSAVHLAYLARKKTVWGPKIPIPIFMDSVLPYCSVTEPRESMRDVFQKVYLPKIAKTKTPGEAALIINASLFKDYKVVYNTRRRATDQSPPDTIRQGMATCTGLSIMLVDALRAVGVPSRLAGIASWPGRGGNHTWVEVWDNQRWHFIGAAEPDPNGLDHGWFGGEAGHAIADQPEHAIFAVTYKETGQHFPLEWLPGMTINAENVTRRYHIDTPPPAPRLMVEVKSGDQRVEAEVVARDAATGVEVLRGKSMGQNADMNLFLSSPAAKGKTYFISASAGDRCAISRAAVGGDTVVHLNFDHLTAEDVEPILKDRFGPDLTKAKVAAQLLADIPASPRTMRSARTAFLEAPDAKLKAEFDALTVSTSDRTSPYLWRKVGTKPAGGWGLVIAMHGGGNAPKSENDSEWHYMFDHYYKDHPEAGGYIYLALRAPNDSWNGFYDDAISPLIERLILQFVKFEGVDPNRVVTCGASHGGYGAFVIGTKIPYRFSAIHPAASAPTDGETEGINLRNVRFTWAVGERDNDYGRHDRDVAFEKLWNGWHDQYGGFDGQLEVVPNTGHLINRFEANKLVELRKYVRQAHPKRVLWAQSDNVLHRFYWIEALAPKAKGTIDASVNGNTITLVTSGQGEIALWLGSELVDLSKPVTVIRDGKSQTFTLRPTLGTYTDGLAQTGDPELAAPVRLVIP